MTVIPANYFLLLAALLFLIGAMGFLVRRNLLVVLMSIELMLNAVNLTLVAFNRMQPSSHSGQLFAFFIIAIAAAEAAVGLAIILTVFKNRSTLNIDDVSSMKN